MTARSALFVVSLALCVGAADRATAQTLTLRIDRGLVTLSARDVPVSEILAQWVKATGATVVNGDRATARVTLEFVNEPERSALAVLLRDVSGYVLAASPSERVPGTATIDRILIAPGGTASASTAPARAALIGTPSATMPSATTAPTTAAQPATRLGRARMPTPAGNDIQPVASVGQARTRADGSAGGFQSSMPAAQPVSEAPPQPGESPFGESAQDAPGRIREPTKDMTPPEPEPLPGQHEVAPNPFGVKAGGVPGTVVPGPRK